jgi:predicted O-methyltransferase YrrM
MPLVDPVIERVLADFERRADEEHRRTNFGAPGTNLDDLLLSVGREAGTLLYLLASGGQSKRILELGTSYGYSTVWLAAAAGAPPGQQRSGLRRGFNKQQSRHPHTRPAL